MSPSFYLCAEEGVGPCVAADTYPCCELLEFMFLIRAAQVTASHGLRVRRFARTGCHDAPRRWQAGCSCNSRRHRDSGLGRREEGAGCICTLKGVPAVILGPPGRADRAHHGADTWITPSVLAHPLLQVQKFSTTEGGVKYFDVKEGNGYSPNPGQIVVLK